MSIGINRPRDRRGKALMYHAIQLEAAFQWYQTNASVEAREALNTREKWFAAMRRINSTICDRALTATEIF